MAQLIAAAFSLVNPFLAPLVTSQAATSMQTMFSQVMQYTGQIRNEIKRQLDYSFQMYRIAYLITTMLLIGKCFFIVGDLFVKLFKFIFLFIGWFISKFIPWFIQFVTCTINKIMSLPQCLLWYGLDTAGWIFYLPFRFIFWIIDQVLFSGKPTITKAEKSMWEYMYKLDNYVHDGLNTGIHLFHFPNSVTATCYKCKISKFPTAPSFPFKEIAKFIRCILTPF